ncbi:hypothetical protein BH10ACI3_BH10ACI3_07320 [soil metagenome]
MKFIRAVIYTSLISLIAAGSAIAQASGSISGSVTDGLGAVIVGATVTAVAADGKQKQAVTNGRGEYSIPALLPGKYTVKAIATKFGLYENADVDVKAGEKSELFVVLTVSGIQENVEVSNDNKVSNDADNNANATVIKDKDLDALPDDPDELASALQALAGASAGPNGGQIYIDGFTGGQLPPKESIREIRINQNPFSAEYDRMGFGRIEILTKPGSDKWRGSVNAAFNDESLNARNPFAVNRASTQMRNFGGNLSGPIQKGKSSFFLDVNNRDNDNNAIINAQIIDPTTFGILPFRRDVRQPTKRFSIGPRVDYAINDKNTLVARYSFSRSSQNNQGIGGESLPTRIYKTESREHEIRLTETMIINAKTVNETRFEFSDNRRDQNGNNTIPTINVSSSFTGGGSQIGNSYNNNQTWELNNFTTTSLGKNSQHSVKFGARIRHVSIADRSENNYGGSFSFQGYAGISPCDLNSDGIVSSIEQYRCKVSGLVDPRNNPTQFSITTGNPLANVSQFDAGLFATDDWRVSPALLISFGLRYENQSNINSNYNFAPRVGYAWSPGAGGAKAPKTVFRGGAGIFYDRFSESYTLNADRFNGSNQLSLLVSANETDPVRKAAALSLLAQPVFNGVGVTNVPTAAQILAALPQSNSIRQISPVLQTPYTMQAAFGVERQLPANWKTTLTGYYIASRTLHVLRTRNVNAPVCPTQVNCLSAPRPLAMQGNINEYDASGTMNQNQFILSFRTNLSSRFSLSGNYRLSFMNGDSDGAGSNPAYAYDFAGEYGRSSGDVRHNFVVFGNITLPWNVSLNPFIFITSGRPFNITKGFDANGDGVFTERPTFGDLQARCSLANLTTSFCNTSGYDPSAIIPRNFGVGPGSTTVNLRVGKTFGFGQAAQTAGRGNGGGQGGGMPAGAMAGGQHGGGRPGGGGGGMFGGGGGDIRRPYNLNLSLNFSNLLNHVNYGTPVGSLSSSRFGQSTSTAGGFGGFGGGGGSSGPNRRIELSARFSW